MDTDAAICSPVTDYTPLMAKRAIDVVLGLSRSLEVYVAAEAERRSHVATCEIR